MLVRFRKGMITTWARFAYFENDPGRKYDALEMLTLQTRGDVSCHIHFETAPIDALYK